MTHSKSILIVDDEKDYCLELKKALDKVGFLTKTANTINQALTEISKRKFDILLVDKMLKCQFSGLALAETINIIRPGIKTILMSGFLGQEARDKTISSIAFGFIEKPFRLSKLIALLEKTYQQEEKNIYHKITFARVDNDKTVTPLNPSAINLLAEELFEGNCSCINYLFSENKSHLFNLAKNAWIDLDSKFLITTRKLEHNSLLLCILPLEASSLLDSPLLELLFGKREKYNLVLNREIGLDYLSAEAI